MPSRRKARCSVDVPVWVRHSHQNLQNTLMKRSTPTRELELIRTQNTGLLKVVQRRGVCVEAGLPGPIFPVSTAAVEAANYDAGVRHGVANAGSPGERLAMVRKRPASVVLR